MMYSMCMPENLVNAVNVYLYVAKQLGHCMKTVVNIEWSAKRRKLERSFLRKYGTFNVVSDFML